MNPSSQLWRLILLALSLTVLHGFCDQTPPPVSPPLDLVTLQLKWKHQFQFAGYYAALEQGYYREAGLDVTLIEGNPEAESTKQVLNGNADFGIAMSDLVSLRAQGEPVVALACIFQHSPTIILAPKRNGIENIHDLQGKRVMLEAHSDELLGYLESEGIPAEKLILSPHEYDISRLLSGDVDAISAYSTDEPFQLLESGIEYSTFTPRAVGIDFYGDILFTSEQQLEEHPARVAAFVEASLKGWEYALAHPDEIIDLILSQYSTRHSREHLQFEARMSERLIMPDVIELGYMNPGRWRSIADMFKQMKLIPQEFTLDGFIYNRNPSQNLGWLYFSLFGAVVVAALGFFLVARFYTLNHALKWEISERQKTIDQLKEAHDQIKTLQGIIPICMHCKGIRDDKGLWAELETYITEHSDAKFSHGICEKCLKKYYPKPSSNNPSVP